MRDSPLTLPLLAVFVVLACSLSYVVIRVARTPEAAEGFLVALLVVVGALVVSVGLAYLLDRHADANDSG